MSQASTAQPVPCGSRAVAVFVLLLLAGSVGVQTRLSLECMAAGLTAHDTVAIAPRGHHDEAGRKEERCVAAGVRRLPGESVRLSLVSEAMWPPPRGPDPSRR